MKLAEDFSEFSIRELKSAINVNAVSTIDIEGDLTIGLSDIPQLGFQLKASDIDLDAIFNRTKADDIKKSPSEQIITEQNTDNIDLSFLQKMNVDGQIDIDSIKVNNVTMSAIKLPFN